MSEKPAVAKPTYQIKISGILDQRWVGWFNEMQITTETQTDGRIVTVLTGPVVDQVALRGMVVRIWDLNMELVSLQRLEDDVYDNCLKNGGTPYENNG